jgi:hypothetical protein
MFSALWLSLGQQLGGPANALLTGLGSPGLLDPAHVGVPEAVRQPVKERPSIRIASQRGSQIVGHRHRARRLIQPPKTVSAAANRRPDTPSTNKPPQDRHPGQENSREPKSRTKYAPSQLPAPSMSADNADQPRMGERAQGETSSSGATRISALPSTSLPCAESGSAVLTRRWHLLCRHLGSVAETAALSRVQKPAPLLLTSLGVPTRASRHRPARPQRLDTSVGWSPQRSVPACSATSPASRPAC